MRAGIGTIVNIDISCRFQNLTLNSVTKKSSELVLSGRVPKRVKDHQR